MEVQEEWREARVEATRVEEDKLREGMLRLLRGGEVEIAGSETHTSGFAASGHETNLSSSECFDVSGGPKMGCSRSPDHEAEVVAKWQRAVLTRAAEAQQETKAGRGIGVAWTGCAASGGGCASQKRAAPQASTGEEQGGSRQRTQEPEPTKGGGPCQAKAGWHATCAQWCGAPPGTC